MADRHNQGAPAADVSAALVESSRQLFGRHPEDVISVVETAVSICSQLEAILVAIKKEVSKSDGCLVRAEHLIEAGEYLASDIGNYLDCQREELVESLSSCGIPCAGKVPQ